MFVHVLHRVGANQAPSEALARHTASLRLIGKELWAWELGAKLLEDRGVEGRALC